MSRITGISFSGILYKVTTLVDGGVRVTFDAPENELEEILKLAPLRGQNLQIGIVALTDQYRENDATEQW